MYGFILGLLVAVVPKIWIEDYNIGSPIYWTVFLFSLIGMVFGYLICYKSFGRKN